MDSVQKAHCGPGCYPCEAPESESGRYSGTLADKTPVIVKGDYGADHSALKLCADACIFIPVLPLTSLVRVELSLGGKDNESTKASFVSCKAQTSTTLVASKGPLRLRNVEY